MDDRSLEQTPRLHKPFAENSDIPSMRRHDRVAVYLR